MSTDTNQHYRRMLTGPVSGFESNLQPNLESPGARAQTVEDSLQSFVSRYLNDDPKLKELAKRVAKEGGEALRVFADSHPDSQHSPQTLIGLEAIVRTDGSRPSFLIRGGEIDLDSSPLGGWKPFLDANAAALRDAIACVGRIDLPGSSAGFLGTGFLVQENLILTNRHVLQLAARSDRGQWTFADGAAIDFGHEYQARDSVNRRKLKRVLFAGAKPIDFNSIDHAKLDLALIEIEPAADRAALPGKMLSINLAPNWWNPGTTVFTIGYPGDPGMSYPPSLLEQLFARTFGYKRMAPGELITAQTSVNPWTLSHDATTLGGNSGSVVLVNQEASLAAGLHYGGRGLEPRENWGHILLKVFNETDGSSSTTLGDRLTQLGVRIRQSNGDAAPRATPERAVVPANRPGPKRNGSPGSRAVVTLRMMQPLVYVAGKSRLEAAELESSGDGETDPDSLADRSGYEADFLEGFSVEMPKPDGDTRSLRRGGSGYVLKYMHFSTVVSASRRMPMLTAANIDGSQSRSLPRVQRWNFDGRLDREDQWGNALYVNNEIDKGHMVRREDPVWGDLATARQANVDTFHYTNSCPQMATVNQQIWLGLENYVLSHTREDDMRVSVFTGPFFTDNDLAYRDALIPKAFWKIVAFNLPDGRPSATGYKVSQARELEELEFVFAGYKTFQVSIQQIADATHIDFGDLVQYDGFSQHERVHGGTLVEQLESFSQIRV